MSRVLLLLILFAANTWAMDQYQFAEPAKQQLYKDIIKETRCMVCQNQNLADSNAELAQDLRKEIYQQVELGKNKAAIKDFLTTRYSDFILYRPPLKTTTWILWFMPLAILMVGIFIWLRAFRR